MASLVRLFPLLLLVNPVTGQGMFDMFGFGGGMGGGNNFFGGGFGGPTTGFGPALPPATAAPDPAAMLDARFTMAEEQMAEVMGESAQSSPERQRIDRLIKSTGGKFTGDASRLNYLVEEYLVTSPQTPGAAPPPENGGNEGVAPKKPVGRGRKNRRRNRQNKAAGRLGQNQPGAPGALGPAATQPLPYANPNNQFAPQVAAGNQYANAAPVNQLPPKANGNQFTYNANGNQFLPNVNGNQFPPNANGNQFPPNANGNQFTGGPALQSQFGPAPGVAQTQYTPTQTNSQFGPVQPVIDKSNNGWQMTNPGQMAPTVHKPKPAPKQQPQYLPLQQPYSPPQQPYAQQQNNINTPQRGQQSNVNLKPMAQSNFGASNQQGGQWNAVTTNPQGGPQQNNFNNQRKGQQNTRPLNQQGRQQQNNGNMPQGGQWNAVTTNPQRGQQQNSFNNQQKGQQNTRPLNQQGRQQQNNGNMQQGSQWNSVTTNPQGGPQQNNFNNPGQQNTRPLNQQGRQQQNNGNFPQESQQTYRTSNQQAGPQQTGTNSNQVSSQQQASGTTKKGGKRGQIAINRLKGVQDRILYMTEQLKLAQKFNDVNQITELQAKLDGLNNVRTVLSGGSNGKSQMLTVQGAKRPSNEAGSQATFKRAPQNNNMGPPQRPQNKQAQPGQWRPSPQTLGNQAQVRPQKSRSPMRPAPNGALAYKQKLNVPNQPPYQTIQGIGAGQNMNNNGPASVQQGLQLATVYRPAPVPGIGPKGPGMPKRGNGGRGNGGRRANRRMGAGRNRQGPQRVIAHQVMTRGPATTTTAAPTGPPPQLGDIRLQGNVKYVFADADGFDTFQWVKASSIPKDQLQQYIQERKAAQKQQQQQQTTALPATAANLPVTAATPPPTPPPTPPVTPPTTVPPA